jgi:hypothetical protein
MYLEIPHLTNPNEFIKGKVYHDVDGNIILYVTNKYYFLDINKNNQLEWYELNYDNMIKIQNNINLKYRTIKLTQDKFSLKGKIINKLDEQNQEQNQEENQEYHQFYDELDENDIEYKTHFKYYPEEKDYYIHDNPFENDVDSEDDYINDSTYNFSKFGDTNIMTCLDRTMDTNSLYDTFVVDQSTKKVLFTLESTQKSSYRVTFNLNNTIELNIVGQKIISYNIKFNKIIENDQDNITINMILLSQKIFHI